MTGARKKTTAQVHETLVYEGEVTSMMTCPPLPASHPRLAAAATPCATEREGAPRLSDFPRG